MAKEKYLGIEIDLDRDNLMESAGATLLRKFYLNENESSPQHAYARAATAYCFGDYSLAQFIYDAISRDWFCPASPVLSNAPELHWPDPVRSAKAKKEMRNFESYAGWLHLQDIKLKGLPISCFLNTVHDSVSGLVENTIENRWMTIQGGGIGTNWSNVRSFFSGITRGGKSPGLIPFLKTVDSDMLAYRQGSTRRGSCAVYLDVTHPEINEFIEMRIPGGDLNRKCLNLHNAVNLDDAFWMAFERGDKFQLRDPASGKVTGEIDARKTLEQICNVRFRTGEPYIFNIDTANKSLNPYLKTKGFRINNSNLCSEIMLPTAPDYSAVCCLSSLNLEKYDEWKDTDLVKKVIRYLDNVIEFFIQKAPDTLWRAIKSAKFERSIGLGVFGFHAFLQKQNVPFESAMAISHNKRIFNDIKNKAYESSRELGKERGVPEGLTGGSARNAHLLAIAPTSNIAIIKASSSGIEPIASNYYVHQTRAGNFPIRNRYLERKVLEYRDTLKQDDQWVNDVWESILSNDGSVQHLEWMDDYDKDVFKTAYEIDQRWVVDLAADRQKFICQGQSLNLFFPEDADINYVIHCHYRAWKKGCKALYYLRTKAPYKREAVSTKVARIELKDGDSTDGCLGCDG